MLNHNLIVSFNGQEGSGKSTIAQMLAEKLGIPRYYMGQIFRDTAEKKGMTLADFMSFLANNPETEKEIDNYMINLPQEEASFVIEGRVAWHLIPQSIKIYLQVDSKIAAQRIFRAMSEKNNRGNEDSNLNTLENIEKSILQRRSKDSKRYFSLYGIHQDDVKNYDFIIDTTNLSIEKVFEKIINFIHEKST